MNSARSNQGGDTADGLDVHVARVGTRLAKSIGAILNDLDGAPMGPSKLARELGISQPVSSRLYKATESDDPIATVHFMPGPESLRRLSEAAGRHGVGDRVIQEANESIARFERLIREVAGDRSGLNTIIGAWLPDVRERSELLSKQAIYKGISQIQGSSVDVNLVTQFVHPSEDGEGFAFAALTGLLGLIRLRPGAHVFDDHFDIREGEEGCGLATLDGREVRGHREVMLEAYCSTPMPAFEIRDNGGVTNFSLVGDEVGLKSKVDLVWAYATRIPRISCSFMVNELPSKRSQFDLLIHRDIAHRDEPLLRIYNTAARGVARIDDPSRDQDQIDLIAEVNSLGGDASALESEGAARYGEMVRHVCEEMGWDASAFCCYRCAIDYPVYGSQVSIWFDTASPDDSDD